MNGVSSSFAPGESPVGLDFNEGGFAGGPVAERAPGIVFGFVHQAACDWVAVDVAELLDEFVVGEDVEIVIAGLPELRARAFEEFRGLPFKNAEGGCERTELRLADEKVDVLGHEDVREHEEVVSASELFERVEKDGAGVVICQVREALVTTEGEEVVVAFSLETLQTARHEGVVPVRTPW
jgi:hypothetical protein